MPEADFAFRGVNVDIHFIRWAFKVHHRQWVAALHEPSFVSATNGLEKGPCCNGSVVDEDVNIISLSSGDVRCADPTAPPFLAWSLLVLNRLAERNKFGSLSSHDVIQSIQHVVGTRYIQQGPSLRFEMESAFWVGESMVHHHVNNAGRFRFRSTLESKTSRRVLKQVFNRNHGALSHSNRFNSRFATVLHRDGCALLTIGFAGDLQFRYHPNASQGFSAKAQGYD